MEKRSFKFPKQIKGWLSLKEGKLLYKLAQINPYLGKVVELGCFQGRSTICLVQGSQKAGGGKVYSVDNFCWDKQVDTLPSFLKNFKKNLLKWQMTKQVIVLPGDTVQIGKKWKGSIRLLFIDASHFYPNVRHDWKIWSKWLVPGGIVSFHDCEWPGVNRFVSELILSGQLKNLFSIKGQHSTGLSYGYKPFPGEMIGFYQRAKGWLKFKLFYLASFWPRFKMNINQLGVLNPKDWRFGFFGRLAGWYRFIEKLRN